MKKSIYRIVSLVVAMAIALTMTAFAADDVGATVTLNGAEVQMGEEFELVVSFSGCGEIKSFQISDFDFGKDIAVVNASSLVENAAISSWKDGKFVVAFDENSTCDGEILKLSLKVADDAITSDVNASFKAILKKMDKDDEVIIPSQVVAGTISIKGLEPADEPEDEPADESEEMTSEKRAKDAICLKIDESSAFAFGKVVKIDEDNDKVVPYIVNGRTLVPLRFVSETLGAEVQWENGWNYCYVNKGDKKIKITFGSSDIEVNGEVVTYDAPVEVVENRTMVPIRFISEELGYHVYWNDPNRAVVITPLENPWVEEREAETSLFMDMLVTFLMMGMI